jgi:transcriptional regulator with XRE-family HTH domain
MTIVNKSRYTSKQLLPYLKNLNKMHMVAQSKNNNIKALMQKHDLTIEMLAQELGLSVSTINRLLMGSKSDPKLSTLRPLAKFFGVSIDELVGERPINLKPGDDAESFDNKYALVQVPIIHWEQVKDAETRVPTLTFALWNNWTVIAEEIGQDSYALVVKQSSLPPPFYFKTIIVIDPKRNPFDNDYVLILHKENPLLCRFILNGIEKCYESLHLEQIFKHNEIKLCGTLVQWTIPYCEKEEL